MTNTLSGELLFPPGAYNALRTGLFVVIGLKLHEVSFELFFAGNLTWLLCPTTPFGEFLDELVFLMVNMA